MVTQHIVGNTVWSCVFTQHLDRKLSVKKEKKEDMVPVHKNSIWENMNANDLPPHFTRDNNMCFIIYKYIQLILRNSSAA